MKISKPTAIAFCPDCEDRIYMRVEPQMGQNVMCPYCLTFLQVIRLNPLKLSWASNVVGEEKQTLTRESITM